jgi:hypothetical protein
MHDHNSQSHSLKISAESDFKIMQIQLLLAKQLRKKISKKKVITTAIRALEEKMGLIAERGSDGDE